MKHISSLLIFNENANLQPKEKSPRLQIFGHQNPSLQNFAFELGRLSSYLSFRIAKLQSKSLFDKKKSMKMKTESSPIITAQLKGATVSSESITVWGMHARKEGTIKGALDHLKTTTNYL